MGRWGAGLAGSFSGIRVARAAVFAALTVTLSAGAHVLLSGTPLPLPAVAAVTAAVFALAWSLAGEHERGYRAIAALLLPLQLGADTVFTTGQETCYGPGGGPVTGPLRLMGVDLLCAGGDVGTPLAGLAAPHQAADPAGPWLLLSAHLVAGLAAAAWLRCGERALARLLRSAAAATFRPLLLAVAALGAARAAHPAPRLPRPRASRAALPGLPLLSHSVLRRGPPAPVPAR
ncbi:hypothetical protein RM780_19825 [Streptomyces sp. DSM 44917]|uniref:Integral membrane protein n=1 Tax=Streptomyces boetiae TaxID=3075541 RepID=A0ABU2LCA2_9ACTN|nr:hypothetical protein [Streptomyces sp. DSM 44917]MDT0309194.1 hypothetical protein [Streptomyces sp. DSM 44917]